MKEQIRNILLGALLAIGLGIPYLQAADVAISALTGYLVGVYAITQDLEGRQTDV